MRGRPARPPPAGVLGEVSPGRGGRVAGVIVLDQEDPREVAMPTAEPPQGLNIVGAVFDGQMHHLHLARMHHRPQQEIDRAMTDVLELLLFDGAWDGAAERTALQDLEIGYLIYADHPDSSTGQPFCLGIAPRYLLRALFELGIQAGGLPVAGPMRLQVHLMQDPTDGPWRDGRDDAVLDGLMRQVSAGPVGDVQALGHGLQAGQGDDLRSLQGGKSGADGPDEDEGPTGQANHDAHSTDRACGRWRLRTASERPPTGSAGRRQPPERSGRAG